ncbi:AAA family ATPase [Niveibacterium sp. SC-1]|uniref:AAA family ATPase n=1 Tax=Niveibacterium sp. SC-1 TaxID=3135646 RepID=UPI00311E397D
MEPARKIGLFQHGLEEYADYLRLLRLRALFAAGAHESCFDKQGALENEHFRDGLLPTNAATSETEREILVGEWKALEQSAPSWPSDSPLSQNLKWVQENFELDEQDGRLLALFAACRQDPTLHTLLERELPDVGWQAFLSLCAIFTGDPREAVAQKLAPSGPLMRCGLLTLDRSSVEAFPSRVTWRTGLASALLRSTPGIAHAVGALVPAMSFEGAFALDAFPHVRDDARLLVKYLDATASRGVPGANLLIYGPPGTGKSELARAITQSAGIQLHRIQASGDNSEAVDRDERLELYQLGQRVLKHTPRVALLFDEAEDFFGSLNLQPGGVTRGRKGWAVELFEANPVPTIWITNDHLAIDPAILRRFDYVLGLQPPPASVRREMATRALAPLGVSTEQIEQVAGESMLTPAMITRAARFIALSCSQNGEDGSEANRAVAHFIRNQRLARNEASPAAREHPPIAYDPRSCTADCDLGELTAMLAETCSARICLYGPPGTGKTAFAKHVAQSVDRPLLSVTASNLLSRYVGGTEELIVQAFESAREDHAVLFLDEADSLLLSRSSAQQTWEVSATNELLCQIERFDGILLAATNLFDRLDPAVLRRFDAKIRFDWLSFERARQLLASAASELRLSMDDSALARLRGLTTLAPGDFALVMRQHRFRKIHSMAEFVTRLEAELAVKGLSARKPIGFVTA